MGDNWSFVLAAYALTALVLFAYWRHLVRRERELERERRP
jgi:heme exporter protein D